MRRLLLLSAPILVAIAGCHRSTPSSAPAETPVAAHVVTVSASTQSQGISVSGVVKPHQESDLAAQIIAPVALVTKREGDHFRKGEVLVRLHAPALASGVSQSEASLQSAEQHADASLTQAKLAADTLARYQQLRERHSVTPYELDQMKAQSAAALAQQQSAMAQVSASRAAVAVQRAGAADATLTAPFAGVVTRRMVDPGAMATPGAPLLHLQSTGGNDVEFAVPETTLRELRLGDSLPVSSNGESSSARIQEIAPATDAGSHSFFVKAALPRETFWAAGTVVQVQLPSVTHGSTVTVPSSAVLQQGGLDAVLVLGADNRASIRYITVGRTVGGSTEILTGAKAGDRILSDGNLTLAGRKIEVLP